MKTLVIAVLFVSSFAFAADLKPSQEEEKTAFDKQWKSILDEVNTACGTKFDAVKTDFENWDKKNFVRARAGTACSTLSYALKEICKSAPFKKAVESKVKELSCAFTGATTDKKNSKANFELKGGVLTLHLDQDQGGSGAVEAIKEFLDK